MTYCPGPVVAHGSYSKHATRIHPSAWKGNSTKLNFHVTEFYEVRIHRILGSSALVASLLLLLVAGRFSPLPTSPTWSTVCITIWGMEILARVTKFTRLRTGSSCLFRVDGFVSSTRPRLQRLRSRRCPHGDQRLGLRGSVGAVRRASPRRCKRSCRRPSVLLGRYRFRC
jgi:hypothetical protein